MLSDISDKGLAAVCELISCRCVGLSSLPDHLNKIFFDLTCCNDCAMMWPNLFFRRGEKSIPLANKKAEMMHQKKLEF